MKWKIPLFFLLVILFSLVIPLCHADSILRRSSNFAYLLGDYNTKVKFSSDLYCTQFGWIDNDGNGEPDRIKFYNAYIGTGTARTFWISVENANLTITKLLFGTSITGTVTGNTGDTSTTTIGGLTSSPEHVRVDGQIYNEWSYSPTDTAVTVTITHSSSHALLITWSSPQEQGGVPVTVYPSVKAWFTGTQTFYPSLIELLQRKTQVTVDFQVESTDYDGDITVFYEIRVYETDENVDIGNTTFRIEPGMTKTVPVGFWAPFTWNDEERQFLVSIYTVANSVESDVVSRLVTVKQSGDAETVYRALGLVAIFFLLGLAYYSWQSGSKKRKKVLGVKT